MHTSDKCKGEYDFFENTFTDGGGADRGEEWNTGTV